MAVFIVGKKQKNAFGFLIKPLALRRLSIYALYTLATISQFCYLCFLIFKFGFEILYLKFKRLHLFFKGRILVLSESNPLPKDGGLAVFVYQFLYRSKYIHHFFYRPAHRLVRVKRFGWG